MAFIFTRQKIDPAERGGAWARRDPGSRGRRREGSVAAAAAILGWEEAAEGLAAQ